jgi:hypothetical protein
MVHGRALVESRGEGAVVPGRRILVRDQLSLWPQQLWIHDRGHDPDTGDLVYGNRRGVPYVLDRVSDIRPGSGTGEEDGGGGASLQLTREIVDPDLSWTLGGSHRTELEYERNMEAIGGPSRPPKRG